MPMPRARYAAVAATTLAAALATAAPATADTKPPVWTVSTSAASSLNTRVDATCHFRRDNAADYPNVYVTAYATTTGAWQTSVRCELVWGGTDRGDRTWTQGGPVVYGEDGFSYVNDIDVQICVSASARFALTDVDAPRYCAAV